jgi:phage terminase small subunit
MSKTEPNYQTAEITHFGVDRRLRAPDRLGDGAKRAFVQIISDHAASHFRPGDLPVLCRFCELISLAERSACELERDGVVLPDGSLSKWFTVHSTVTKQIGALAARLRIGPSSRTRQAPKREPATLSYYQMQDLREARRRDGT